MRIAMLTDSYHPTKDGVVTSVSITKKALESEGHEVFIVAPDPGKEFRLPGVIYIGSLKFRSYAGYFIPIMPSKALRTLESLKIDIIHVHGIAVMAVRGLVYGRLLKVPVVLTFHTMVGDVLKYYLPVSIKQETAKKWIWKYIRAVLKRTDCVIAPSPGIKNELLGLSRPKRIEVIPTGTDVSRFRPGIDGSEFRRKYGLSGKVVASVGRLSYEKNIDLVVRSVRDIDATLLIVGDGPCMKDLRILTEELGMTDKVVFTGYIDNSEISAAYAASDVLVSASGFETQGLSVLEAMACGIPVVCLDARAFHDIIQDGVNGFLFKGEDDCGDAIIRGLNASDEVRRNSLKTATDNSEEKVSEMLTGLYEELIREKRK
ncbi:MAG: glycosyltransferase [Candidatus Methanomethylophilaceae archaeon]|nr:glycosyltransferase [Candidatus Methanomethylophilaceae archaeon]